jgi:hypothetical protein
MGGGGMNMNQAGAMNQWQPGFNQSQLDYIRSQGKLPGALGGGALNPAQQNFFNVKGYLPKGFAGGDDLGQQYYRPQQQQQQYNPYGTWSGGMPLQQPQQGGFSQNQLNYIQSQGKLPGALGGGALNPAQQNFFNVKGYLPKGFAGGDNLGQQYYRPQPQSPIGNYTGGPIQAPAQLPMGYYGPAQSAFGLGGGYYPSPQQLAGSNKGPPAVGL